MYESYVEAFRKKKKKKAFGITEKKRGKGGGRSGIGGKYRSKNIR